MKFLKQSRFIIRWEFTTWVKLYIIMNKIQYLIISSSRESSRLKESITYNSFDTQRPKKWYSLLVGISTVIKIFYHFPSRGEGGGVKPNTLGHVLCSISCTILQHTIKYLWWWSHLQRLYMTSRVIAMFETHI